MRRGRPLVGVTGSERGGRTMWLFNRLAVWRAGGRAVRITTSRPYPIDDLDALVVGGGDDISADLYGGEVVLDVKIDPERDDLELRCLEHAHRCRLPVLGICRGAQLLNVFRGGSLHADIHRSFEIRAGRPRTSLPRLNIEIRDQTRLRRILGIERCRVNTLHHQSIDRVGDGLKISACDQDGIVQGVDVESDPFCVGVQWHPEFLVADRRQQNLFRQLVACTRQD